MYPRSLANGSNERSSQAVGTEMIEDHIASVNLKIKPLRQLVIVAEIYC